MEPALFIIWKRCKTIDKIKNRPSVSMWRFLFFVNIRAGRKHKNWQKSTKTPAKPQKSATFCDFLTQNRAIFLKFPVLHEFDQSGPNNFESDYTHTTTNTKTNRIIQYEYRQIRPSRAFMQNYQKIAKIIKNWNNHQKSTEIRHTRHNQSTPRRAKSRESYIYTPIALIAGTFQKDIYLYVF